MRKIAVIGSSNVDFILKMDRLPRTGETVTDALFLQTYGGKGANQAVGAAKAGGDVWFINCVGDDAFGRLIKDNLRQAGVHVDYVSEERGVASGAAHRDGGRRGRVFRGPRHNYKLTPDIIRSLAPILEDAAMVLLQYEVTPESLYAAIDVSFALGKPVMFNLAPARALDESILSRIAYLLVNETEAEWLCGFPVDKPDRVVEAADTLLRKGVQTVVLTLGAGDVFWLRPACADMYPLSGGGCQHNRGRRCLLRCPGGRLGGGSATRRCGPFRRRGGGHQHDPTADTAVGSDANRHHAVPVEAHSRAYLAGRLGHCDPDTKPPYGQSIRPKCQMPMRLEVGARAS